jgi:hypothetical protein
MAFRPRATASRKPAKAPAKSESPSVRVSEPAPVAATNLSQTHSLPIPLRSDLTVFVHGVPFDLSKAEAKRIANVIMAMAVETET